MTKDVSKLKIVNDNTEYLFKDLQARNNISSLLGSGILTSQTQNTFFAAPSNKDGLPQFRKITANDLPILNQDTTGIASYAKGLIGRDTSGNYFNTSNNNVIIAEWNTKSDDRWYLKAAETYECRVDYATTSGKVKGALKFGSKSFNGSLDVILLGSDLGSVDLTSEQTITGQKTFSGETYLDSLNTNTGLISGNLRVINGIFGNLTGNVTGNLSGNANTATKLQTARTLTIGNTEKSFDGSSNVSWTLSEIGAASSGHTHNYLPLSGGTITGQLYLTGLEEGSSDVTDNTELLTSYASNNGFGDTNATGKVYKRDAIHVYNYIKNKLDSVYSAIGHTHSYLPLSGGTITGTNIRPLAIKSNDAGYSAIQFITSENNYITFGYKHVVDDAIPQMFFTNKNGWSTEYTLLHSGNYNSYSPKLNGTGASGTWDINITGNAKTATNIAWSGITEKPTKLSDFTDDLGTSPVHTHSQYLTSHQSLANRLYTSQVSSDQTNISWAKTTAKSIRRGFVYNTSGAEYSYLFGFSGSSTSEGNAIYGAVLKMGYADNYLRILRVQSGTWKTDDWEKISAGYADNAGIANNVDWSGITDKPNFVNSFGTKTGDITIRGGQTNNGSVNLAMSNNELQASIVGLGSNAYTSTAYLPLTGGTLNSDANIVWRDRRAWGDSSATYPYSCGGLYWSGTSDSIKIYGKEEQSDLLNLWITFGDDSGHAIKIDDCGNVYTVYHTGNLSPMTTSHPANSITKTNIDNWNAVHTWYTIATADDTTNTIDTWKEIEAFVSSFTKEDNLATYLANNYLAKSGGTISSTNFGPLIIERSGSTNAAAIQFKNSNGILGYIGMGSSADGGLIRWNSDLSERYTILDSSNSSVSLSGSTLSVKINGTTKSLTNTDTKVTQIVTTSNNTDYRPVILGESSNDQTNSFSNTTSSVYAAANVYIRPDNGNLYTKGSLNASTTVSSGTSVSAGTTVTAATSITSTAGDFYVGGTSGSRCHIKMDTTNKCIKFIFD